MVKSNDVITKNLMPSCNFFFNCKGWCSIEVCNSFPSFLFYLWNTCYKAYIDLKIFSFIFLETNLLQSFLLYMYLGWNPSYWHIIRNWHFSKNQTQPYSTCGQAIFYMRPKAHKHWLTLMHLSEMHIKKVFMISNVVLYYFMGK